MASSKDKHLDNAQKFILKGQLERAIKEYEQVVAMDPKDIRHRQKLAELLVRVNRKADALGEYDAIGKSYADNSFYLKAIAVYKQMQKISPEDIRISLQLAKLNEKQGLMGNALAEYGRVYSDYERRGLVKDALAILESMISIDPANLSTRLKMAENRFAAGAVKEAYAEFFSLALHLHTRRDMDAFRQVCRRIITLFPEKKSLLLDILAARLEQGDQAEIMADIQEIFEAEPTLELWQLYVKALERTGDIEKLRNLLQRGVILFPDLVPPKASLLKLALEQKDASLLARYIGMFGQSLVIGGATEVLEDVYREVSVGMPSRTDILLSLRNLIGGPRGTLSAQSPSRPSPGEAVPPPDGSSGILPGGSDIGQHLDISLADQLASPNVSSPAETAPDLSQGTLPVEGDLDLDLDLSLDDLELESAGNEEVSPLTLPVPEEVEPATDGAVTGDPGAEVEVDFEFSHDLLDELELAEEDEPFPPDPVSPVSAQDFSLSSAVVDPVDEPIELDLEHLQEPEDDPFLHLSGEIPSAGSATGVIDAEEMETHFNLGLAYRDMGLYEEAVTEFAAASADPSRRVDCLILQGICYREKGDLPRGEEILKSVLVQVEKGELAGDPLALRFELALMYEAAGRLDEAIAVYEAIHAANPLFQDVRERIQRLNGESPDDLEELELVELEEAEYL